MVIRQVRWNMFTDSGEQIELRHRYTIAILNEPREIERIKQRFFSELSPLADFTENYDSLIPRTKGLHLKIFSFSSRCGEISNPRVIYYSKNFKKDRDLSDRNECKLEKYAQNLIKG